ncbi:MAG TPA: GNAT family N-acetyltransferase [Puia sp.]|nr:GNAT family N-acetyltransferase [Puia sp.]
MTITKDEFEISTDRERLDLDFIHEFLSKEAYWSKNIPFDTVKRSADNSLNFGLFHKERADEGIERTGGITTGRQIGYARIITDYSTIAYLGDVFVISAYRGKGLSKWLMEQVVGHPDLQGLRRWVLLTADAHELYKKFGWQPVAKPEWYMERVNPNIYNT